MSHSRTVYLGTNIEYIGQVDIDDLFETTIDPETGAIQGIFLEADSGMAIMLEKISTDIFNNRTDFYAQHVWINVAEMKLFPSSFVDLTVLTNSNKANGVITSGNMIAPNGESVDLILVSKIVYNANISDKDLFCVYADTHFIYPGNIHGNRLTLSQADGLLKGILLLDDGSTVALDYITLPMLKDRNLKALVNEEKLWVKPRTNEVVSYPSRAQILNEIKYPNSIRRTLLSEGGDKMELEGISRAEFNDRDRRSSKIWIDVDAGEPFPGLVDISMLKNLKMFMGSIVGGTLSMPNGRVFSLTNIDKAKLLSYRKVWIKADTFDPIPYPRHSLILSEEKLTNTLKRKLFLEDGSIIDVECIKRMLLKKRIRNNLLISKVRMPPVNASSTSFIEEASSDDRPAKKPRTEPTYAFVESTSSASMFNAYERGNEQAFQHDMYSYHYYPSISLLQQQSYLPMLAQFVPATGISYAPNNLIAYPYPTLETVEPSHRQIQVAPEPGQLAQHYSLFANTNLPCDKHHNSNRPAHPGTRK